MVSPPFGNLELLVDRLALEAETLLVSVMALFPDASSGAHHFVNDVTVQFSVPFLLDSRPVERVVSPQASIRRIDQIGCWGSFL